MRWLWVGACSSCHEHNNAHLRSKNVRGFLGYLRTYWPPQQKNLNVFRKKYSNKKLFHYSRYSGRSALFRAYRQTDMTKLIVAISRTQLKHYSKS